MQVKYIFRFKIKKWVGTMKISAKTKIITIGIATLLVLGGIGVILWHQPTQAIPESTVNQTAQKVSAVSSAKSVSSKKNISDEQIKKTKDNQNEDAQKTQAIAFLDSIEKNNQEKATVNVKENKKDINGSEQAQQYELLRQQIADEAKTNIPILIEQWKTMMARRDALGTRTDRSEADDKELTYLEGEKRTEIEARIRHYALNYQSAFPEEGAIFYPDGWIGQLLKPIGMVWTHGPLSSQ
jgi:peptidyl-tRNA hydrolase